MLSRAVLTQTCTLIRKVGETDNYRRPIFDPNQLVDPDSPPPMTDFEITIPCRKGGTRKYYPTNNTLREFNSIQYITIDEVNVGDYIDGQIVIGVSRAVGLNGSFSHYEVDVGNFKE